MLRERAPKLNVRLVYVRVEAGPVTFTTVLDEPVIRGSATA